MRKLNLGLVAGLVLGLLLGAFTVSMAQDLRSKTVNGLDLIAVEDPAGNGQSTVEVIYRDSEGTPIHSGLYVGVHGGGPLNLRALVGNANTETSGVFESDPSTHRISVNQL